MKKFKVLGISGYAKDCLDDKCLGELINLIGTTCEESEKTNDMNEPLLIMADGDTAHKDFLKLEEIKCPKKPTD